MALRIFNSLTREKQEFQPVHPGKVGMYVCGMTVYDMCHIGHARSVVLFDVIYRYLLKRGYDVTYVRNFTDVDDKIINRANAVGENWKSLAERFITEFYVDMDALRVKRPTFEPKATNHIQQIQSLIEDLIAKGLTAGQSAEVARRSLQVLAGLPDWNLETAEPPMRALVEELGYSAGQVFGILRAAVTGQKVSPPLFESMEIIGREPVLARIQRAVELLADG